jgi:biopolymer transport protein ExbD
VAIKCACPRCGKVNVFPDSSAGRATTCSACQGPLVVSAGAGLTAAPDEEEEQEEKPLLPPKGESVKVHDLVDMTAMVDIVFFLLIFFLVTSMQGVASSIGLPNPDPKQTAKSAAPAAATAYLTVRVDHDSMVWLEGDEVTSEQELRTKLREAHEGEGGANKMAIVANGEAQYSTMVMVMDAGNDAGMEEIRLAVVEDDSAEQM